MVLFLPLALSLLPVLSHDCLVVLTCPEHGLLLLVPVLAFPAYAFSGACW